MDRRVDLEARMAYLLAAVNTSDDAVLSLDTEGRVTSWNRGAQRLFGVSDSLALGAGIVDFVADTDREAWQRSFGLALAGSSIEHLDLAVRRRDGTVVPTLITAAPVHAEDGRVLGTSVVVRDIGEQRLAQATLADNAQRVAESEALAHVGSWVWDAVSDTVQWSEEQHRIHGISPAEFGGTMSEQLGAVHPGHRPGVALALQESLQTGTAFDQEFQVVQPDGSRRWVYARATLVVGPAGVGLGLRGIYHDITERHQSAQVLLEANERLTKLALYDRLTGLPNRVLLLDRLGGSMTKARELGARVDATPEVVLTEANIAMHEAKRGGKARFVSFQPRMHEAARVRHRLGRELHQALAEDQFVVWYQPVVDLLNGAVVGAEALVRWEHPTRGLVGPDDFISRAEETGLIVPLGAWVLRQACTQAMTWQRQTGQPLTIAVNVSGRQLREPDFVETVRSALRDSGLAAGQLCLEMTESILMERDEAGLGMLRTLREDGVHLAIDDFGTGYSSLAALRRLPVDQLKIDQSFVAGLPDDEDAGTIAWAIVHLGHALGLQVLAEGVETQAQQAELMRFGSDHAQGFLFSQAVPTEQISELVATMAAWPPRTGVPRAEPPR